MPQHLSAEKAQDGMTICGAKCHIPSLPVVATLRVALILMMLQPGEREVSFPHRLLQYAQGSSLLGNHRQFMENSATANPIQTRSVLSWDRQHLGLEA